tara:strand:- start:6385 stop:6855 length:471 start_codon:yes stop_codon:yes gene_type:complete
MKVRNDNIMHAVWRGKAGFSNAVTSQSDIERICEPVYEKFGAEGEGGYNACYSATNLCVGSPTLCSEAQIWEKYSQALSEGYSADFQSFKRRSQLAGYLTAAGQILQGLFTNKEQAPPPGTGSVQPMKSDNTMIWVIGGVAVLGLGVGIYFLTRNK